MINLCKSPELVEQALEVQFPYVWGHDEDGFDLFAGEDLDDWNRLQMLISDIIRCVPFMFPSELPAVDDLSLQSTKIAFEQGAISAPASPFLFQFGGEEESVFIFGDAGMENWAVHDRERHVGLPTYLWGGVVNGDKITAYPIDVVFGINKSGVERWEAMFWKDKMKDAEMRAIVGGRAKGSARDNVLNLLTDLFYTALTYLNTRGIVRHRQPEPAKLNAQRLKRGKVPIVEHWTLEIDPSVVQINGEHQGGTHASPRLHIRRGHVRQLANGTKAWVRPHLVGSAERGKILKDYIVKPSEAV